jgi:3-oxoadipate enol-lactonase
MVLEFRKSSLKQLASLKGVVNKFHIEKREYPLMIGVGEYDHNMAMKAAKMWSETDPNCKFVIFKDAGHIVNMDVPNEFNKTLEDFLQNEF